MPILHHPKGWNLLAPHPVNSYTPFFKLTLVYLVFFFRAKWRSVCLMSEPAKLTKWQMETKGS